MIFFALGLSESLIGNLFSDHRSLLRQIGALLVIVMGLVMLGILTPRWMMKDKR